MILRVFAVALRCPRRPFLGIILSVETSEVIDLAVASRVMEPGDGKTPSSLHTSLPAK